MAFVINFQYEPKTHKKKYLTGKIINWKTFSVGNIKYSVFSKGSSLVLVVNPRTKSEATVLKHFLVMNPDKKHMIALTSEGKTVIVSLDNLPIKTVTLPKIEKPKQAKVKKSKPKKTKTKTKTITIKPKTIKSKTKESKPKETKPKKKKPKRLKPKKFKSKK